jgi:gliding motility-associated-like protein
MKKRLLILSFILFTLVNFSAFAQNYNMNTSAVNTCSGNFYDPGGIGGNYGNNNLNTMTFCSSTPGDEIVFNFTLFDVENGFDDLMIYDGPNAASPLIGTYTGTNSPGTVSSTSGCLTFVWDSDGSVTDFGWAATISCFTPAPPTCVDGIMNGLETGVDCGGPTCPACPDCNNGIQDGNETDIDCGGACAPCPTLCNVDITDIVIGPAIDCNGGDVELTAVGVGSFEYVLYNDFNAGAAGAGWSSTGGAAFGEPCGANPTGTAYYWASTAVGTPQLTTIPFDVSCGGVVNFDMNYATQGGAAPCEGPDLPNEGVTFQYSTDGGTTWTVMGYWDPLGGNDPILTAWNTYTFIIPPGAMTANTTFQWIQNNSSGACCDNWGVDNVSITSLLDCTPYWYDWSQVPGSPDAAVQNETVTTTTTYIVTYTNGIDACYDTVTIVVPLGTTADAGLDQVYCAGSPGVVIGLDPVTPDDGATFSWDNGAGAGTIDLIPAGGMTNGQGTVSPVVTTTYEVTVDFNGCQVTDQVTVVVDAPPTASNPAAINVQCAGDIPVQNINVVTDEADDFTAPPAVTYVGDVSDGLTCPETITRTYRVTDGCGNFVDVTQLIIINDTQVPLMNAAPGAVAVQCAGDVPAMTNLGWTDNCDGAGNVAGNDVSDGLTCPETITRTWTYTDACGNASVAVTQTITVNDTQVPVFVAPPANVTVECAGDVPAMTNLGWTDNCDGAANVAGADGALIGGPCGGTITRTWTYTDACGNNATVTQTITVDDTTLPTATNPLPQLGVPPVFDALQVTDEADNCSVPDVTNGGDVSDGGNCPEIITRTYIITDACGNTINVTQTFTIGDAILPTASNPLPINVECQVNVPAADPTVVTDEADNGVLPIVTWEDDTSDGLTCPETILRRYRVTDNCGNFIFVTQTITVIDITAPIMNASPAAVAVQCIGDLPAMVDLGYTDNCDAPGTVTGADVSDGVACPETITRTWTFTDACGNNATETQIITVQDTQVPVFAAPPAALTVECVGDVPVMTDLGWTDNCDGAGDVTGADGALIGGACGGTITRTWTFTDACGNNATVTQTITVDDTTLPTASNPATTTAPGGPIPAVDITVVIDEADNCTVNPVVAFVSEVSDNNPCPETITRVYSVTDDCGNTINVTHLIVITDPILPTGTAPATVNVECIGDVPANDPLLIIDEADNQGVPVVAFVGDVSDGLTCPETITRTYSITDVCGNAVLVTQLIIVNDVTNPTGTAPANINFECIGDVPAANILDVNDEADNCTVNPIVAFVGDVSDGLTCPETITRTYSITDDCGSQITVDQLIIVNDVTNPTGTAPATVNVECIGDVPVNDPLLITNEADNCTVNPVVAFVGDVSDGLTCPETITRTYSITDDCGNQITVDQLIIVNDVTNPTGTAPATVNVECIADVPANDPLLITNELDNCTVNPVVAFVGDVSDGLTCPETITRTYSITDDCGNQITVDQLIIVNDVTLPTASNPATTTVPGGPIPAVDITVVIDEADNCTVNPVVAFVSEVSDNNPCPETITRIYSVTDECGNTINVTHLIVITDPILPTGTAPATVNVECIGDVPANDPLLIIDEADNQGVPVVAFVGDVSDGLTCPETITRTYSITDDCGNQITVDQLIIVNDVTNPTGTAPANVNVECIGDVPANDPLLITNEADNCTVNPVVAFVGDVSDGLTCPETITRTYSITDDCGNQITVGQLIIVNDVTLPTASNLPPINVPGSMDVPAWNILDVTTEADNCSASPVVAFVSDVSDGNVCNGEIITRTYSVTDDCGNQILITQEITIDAVPAPIDAGLDLVICQGDLITLLPSNPWNVPVVWNPVVPAGQFDPLVTTTYILTADNLGCISTDDVTVTVTPLPVVSFSADVLSGCAPLEVTFTNTTPGITSDCVWSIGGVPYTGCTVTTSLGAGLYDVTLETTNGLGCSSLVTYTDYIYVEAVPLAQFTPSQTQMSSIFTEVVFTNNSVNATDYLWSMGDGASGTSVNASHTFPSDEGGSYLVELIAMSPLGCADTTWVKVNVSEEVIYYVPNTFTPDGDTYNEYFKPIFTSGYDPYDYDLFIFNRWGETIWESHDSSIGWDGTYGASGKLVQNGTYTWRIEFKTTETDKRILVTGHVNVLD